MQKKNAPRCWFIKLTKATQLASGAKRSTHDDHLLFQDRTQDKELDFMATEHVDDIKPDCPMDIL